MMLACLFLLSIQVQTVTVTIPPTPLPRALELLSKASGRHLDAAPALSNEVVLTRLKDATVDVALAHLADSLCAKWEHRRGGIERLAPDAVKARKKDEAEALEQEKQVDLAIKYLQKRFAEQPEELNADAVKATQAKKKAENSKRRAAMAARDFDNAFHTWDSAEEAPGWRAAAQLAQLLDERVLAAMPEDAREVWAENPTPMQHPFPDGSDAILAKYRREMGLIMPDATVARMKMAVFQEFQPYMMLIALDGQGKTVDRTLVSLSGDLGLFKLPASKRPGALPAADGNLVEIPQDAREARIALSNRRQYRGQDADAILTKWRPRILDPVHFEPTQWHIGEDMILAADGVDKNLIGEVSDTINGQFWLVKAPAWNPEKVAPNQILAKYEKDLLPTADGWLVMRTPGRQFRYSRQKEMERLAQTVREGGISVDVAADWASQSTDRSPFVSWSGDYLNALFGLTSRDGLQTLLDTVNLRIWASLGHNLISRLRRGEVIRLTQVPGEAQTQIAHMIYWRKGIDDDQADPTDQFPNGIKDGTLSITSAETKLIGGWQSKDGTPTMLTSTTAENIGIGQAQGNNWFKVNDRFRLGVNRVYTLHFLINPGQVPMTAELSETLFDPSADVLDKIPAGFLADIEKARLQEIAHPKQEGEFPFTNPPPKRVIPPGLARALE